MKFKFKVGGVIYIIVLDFVKKVDGVVVFVVNKVWELELVGVNKWRR